MDVLAVLAANLGLIVFTIATIGLSWYLIRAMVHPEQTLGGAPP